MTDYLLEKQKATFIGEKFSFATLAVNEANALRVINAARREGVVKDAEYAVRVGGAEIMLSFSVRRTAYKGQDAFFIWFTDVTRQKQLQGDVEKALEDANKAISLKPDEPDGYYRRADVYVALNKDAEAKADETKAAELEAKAR